MPTVRAFALGSLMALSAWASPAAAADPRAQTLFDEGLAAMEAGRYDEGCPKLAESYRLDPLPGALFTVAECEVRWGRNPAALAHYEEYLARFDRMSAAERAKQKGREKVAASQIAALKSARGSEPSPKEETPTPPPSTDEGRLVVAPPHEQQPAKPAWAWAVGGVGVAALMGGAATSLIAVSASNEVDDRCRAHVCDRAGLDAVDKAKTFGWIGTGLLAAGAIGVTIATVALVAPGASRLNRAASVRAHLSAYGNGAVIGGTF